VREIKSRMSLESAWQNRITLGLADNSQTYRVFHGPGDATVAGNDLAEISIDRFGDHYWITAWETLSEDTRDKLKDFLIGKIARSAVILFRPRKGPAQLPQILFGDPPQDRFAVTENGMRFLIQFRDTLHPGLFLDHAPLRAWLKQNSDGLTVLNTFAYTGSLSVAAGLGGAAMVTTLDLSPHYIDWAKQNWSENNLPLEKSDFIFGDVFEWLPRFHKRGRLFDMIIVDPPSSSRGKHGHFSTKQNLVELHDRVFPLLAPGGILVTSINSAQITWRRFEADILQAADNQNVRVEIISKLELPKSFPTRTTEESYLKGLIIKKQD
jgi:23S rRNA (cytosine1962-C5)-methyltransferase